MVGGVLFGGLYSYKTVPTFLWGCGSEHPCSCPIDHGFEAYRDVCAASANSTRDVVWAANTTAALDDTAGEEGDIMLVALAGLATLVCAVIVAFAITRTRNRRSLKVAAARIESARTKGSNILKVQEAKRERTWRVDPKDIALGRELGRGSFGVVHEGRWHGTAVAVKLLPFEASASDAVGLFTGEVATMINFHVRAASPSSRPGRH